MARATTFENKKPELDRLHRYESRLQRQLSKDSLELRELQSQRTSLAKQHEDQAMRLQIHFSKQGKTWNPADFGFVWSTGEIAAMIQLYCDRFIAENPMPAAA